MEQKLIYINPLTFYDFRRGVVLFRPPRLANKFEDGTVSFPADEKINSHKIKKFIQENM